MKFNGLLTRKPLFARASGVRCVLSVYLAGQFGGGKLGGAAGGRGCYTMQGTPVYGEGGSGKTAGPFWAWYRIHHPHPLPHSTAFNRPMPDIIPPRQISPVYHRYPHTACRVTRRGYRKRGWWGLWKRRGEIITGNSPGYGLICCGPVFVRMAWATNLCE